MDSPTIRPYRPEDDPAIERCFVELQDFERSLGANRVPGATIAARYRRLLLAHCREADGALFVAEDGGDVVGFVAVFAHEDSHDMIEAASEHAHLSDIVVLPAYRGLGFGRALLQRAEAYARARGATALTLDVLVANASAHSLYHSDGFRDEQIRMQKRLS